MNLTTKLFEPREGDGGHYWQLFFVDGVPFEVHCLQCDSSPMEVTTVDWTLAPCTGRVIVRRRVVYGSVDDPPPDNVQVGDELCDGPLHRNSLAPVTDRETSHKLEPAIDWVIVGGESGPGARPMARQWARDIRDQCHAAGVPFHFKQWGEWRPLAGNECARIGDEWPEGTQFGMSRRVGKKAAGRELDGRTWDEYP